MASKERKIVDVRDLFGQAKEKVELTEPEELEKTTSDFPFSKSGWGNGGLGEYNPKACSTSGGGEVFFGGPGPSGSSGRQKRQAPKAPVMVDMDVGIEEQLGMRTDDTNSNSSGSSDVSRPAAPPTAAATSSTSAAAAAAAQEGPWSFGRPPPVSSTTDSRGHSGETNVNTSRGQLGTPSGGLRTGSSPSRSGVSSGSDAGPNTNNIMENHGPSAMMNGTRTAASNKYEGRPLPPPPPPTPPTASAGKKTPGPRSQSSSASSGAGGNNVKDMVSSNFSLQAKTPSRQQQQQQRHGGRDQGPGGGGEGGDRSSGDKNISGKGDSGKSFSSLDHSSSGVETDDNGTPDNTIQSTRSRPTAPPPPLPPALDDRRIESAVRENGSKATSSSPNVDSSYHTEDDESDFEDEVTLNFDDEDEEGFVEGGRRQVFQEYHGDDYGQFLNDDSPVGEPAQAPSARTRKKRQRKKQSEGGGGGGTPGGTVSSTGNASSSKKRTLKGRLAAVFMGNANGNSHKSQPEARSAETGSTIHTFSFADSKIGNLYLHSGSSFNGNGDSAYGSTSGSGSGGGTSPGVRDLAPCDSAYGGDRKWWNTDTLSARTLASNSDVMLGSRRTSSVVNDNVQFHPAPNSAPRPNTNGGSSETDDGFNIPDGLDFESKRKSVIYGIPTDQKSQKKGSIFRRFKKDGDKTLLNSVQDNTVTNPLAAMADQPNDTSF